MPKTVPTSKRNQLHPFLQQLKNPQTKGSVSEIQPWDVSLVNWETLIDISEEASVSSLRDFIINHIGFKAYIIYKLKQKKAIWEADINMLASSLEDLGKLKKSESHNEEKLNFLINLLDEDELEQYTQWLNQNNL